MSTLACPSCQTTVLSDDRFCEVCGTPLSGVTPASKGPPVGCQKCDAPVTAIDADGYCTVCGFRNQGIRLPQEFDHVAIVINSHLAGVTDRGIQHQQNEDYFAIHQQAEGAILVVCDGVSSSTAPETASQAASKAACDGLSQALSQGTIGHEHLTAAIAQAQVATTTLPEASADEPPSTTIVAAVVQNGMATIGWLGDSRAYWIGPTGHQILTKDHSWFNEQVDSGQLTAAEAHHDAKAHAITRWLGADADDELAQTIQFTIPGAGYFLLCSDGLWNYLSDADHLAALIADKTDAAVISQCLIDYANAKGGRDNITVTVLVT
jgi:PPM family protein phosphatase